MSTASSPPAAAARKGGAVLGLVVFFIGIALVGYVFYMGRVLFDTPPPTIPSPPPAPLVDSNAAAGAATAAATTAANANTPSVASAVGPPLIQFLQRLLVLFVMCVAGSVVASRGIELFFKALAVGAPTASDKDSAA